MSPKLSIITVNLNNSSGLQKTIESVIYQSFTDFEFIVIDGSSIDGSKEIIELFSNKITYWVCEKDTGIFNAMNKGIRQAKGEYCLFLNSGDFLYDNHVLEKVFQLIFIEDIVVGDCLVSQNGKIIFKVEPPSDITLATFYGRTLPHQTAFIRRNLFDKLGYYSESFRLHSDFAFFVKALIVYNSSYRHMPVTVAEYNLEGLSSQKRNHKISSKEYDEILSSHFSSRIIADHKAWEKERNNMKVLYWVKSKPLLYKPISWIYDLAVSISKIKKIIITLSK